MKRIKNVSILILHKILSITYYMYLLSGNVLHLCFEFQSTGFKKEKKLEYIANTSVDFLHFTSYIVCVTHALLSSLKVNESVLNSASSLTDTNWNQKVRVNTDPNLVLNKRIIDLDTHTYLSDWPVNHTSNMATSNRSSRYWIPNPKL